MEKIILEEIKQVIRDSDISARDFRIVMDIIADVEQKHSPQNEPSVAHKIARWR